MLIRYADWKKPTDGAYAFRLRAAAEFRPQVPALGTRSDIRDVAQAVFCEGEAERFAQRIDRWGGPEDLVDGQRPYCAPQLFFEEREAPQRVARVDLEDVLRGTVLVLRAPSGQTDYLLRDHHMLDVALYHYFTRGELPRSLFHADRHSDWCKDSYLEARRPQQAATWWPLFEGLKRPEDGAPVLPDAQIFFTTAIAERRRGMEGRDIGYAGLVPYSRDPDALGWSDVLAQPSATETDWLSLDLDYFQPSAQLALTSPLIRDARFERMMRTARVRVFVLSPQFTNGGDKMAEWKVHGSVASSQRLLNLLRAPTGRAAADLARR